MRFKQSPHHAQTNAGHPGESGQALIETAITLTMLVIVLLGAAELGRIGYAAIQVTNAAKAAAQYGGQSRTSASDVAGIKLAAALEASALPNLQTNVLTPNCFCANDPSTAVDCQSLTACQTSKSTLVESITIQTSDSFDPLIHLPGMPATITLHGQAIQQVLSSD